MILPKRGQYTDSRNITQIHILGGTHGNERTGLHALQYINSHLDEFKMGDIENIHPIFANSRAILKNTRYVEKDLNRSYQYDYERPPQSAKSNVYEINRAFEIRKEIGALEKPVDFVIDLHTTTANMGNCLIVTDSDPWTQALAQKMLERIPNSYLIYEKVERKEELTSSALALNHVTLEMGPIEQGVAKHPKILEALINIKHIIQSVSELNGKEASQLNFKESPIYIFEKQTVDYPRDSKGVPIAYIHPDFLHKDYSPLKLGQAIFIDSQGKEFFLEAGPLFPSSLIEKIVAGEKICPIFIGESAYVEKGIAFGLVSASSFSK